MYFPNIPMIPYEGPNQIISGKPMKEHLPFAMAQGNNLCAGCRESGRSPASIQLECRG